MKKLGSIAGTALLGAFVLLAISGCAASQSATATSFPNPPKAAADPVGSPATTETAVFAGGCFWGVQGVFERLKGVTNTVAGFSGGSAATAHYDIVSTGTTGHAESVQVTFDPSKISYGTLLKVFFSVVQNPTELDYQGPDHGTQYRSVIFYENAQQQALATEYIHKLTAAHVYNKPIVTQVVRFKAFYPAAAYHQHFMDKHPNYPYIVMWDKPKVAKLKQLYPNLIASTTPAASAS